jgi:hypothetical protein
MPLPGPIIIAGSINSKFILFYFIGNKSYPFGDNSNKYHVQCTYLLSKLNFRVFKCSTAIIIIFGNVFWTVELSM